MSGPSVAVIGGGISGLVCGARLQQLNISNVTVFDTGKHGPGGRCSSRTVTIEGDTYIFDHSSQYFTVSHHKFANVVSFLHSKGAVKIWNPAKLGHLDSKGQFVRESNDYQAFVGVNGMQSIPQCLSNLVKVHKSVWVSDVHFEPANKKWKVDKYGYFDYLVIAHNGKCADQLMSSSGIPAIHRLLQVKFTDRVNLKDPHMQLSSLWVLLVGFKQSLRLQFEGCHVEDSDISWLSNNSAKLKGSELLRAKTAIPGMPSSSKPLPVECWTIISTPQFGKLHKVPQEMIPPKKAEEVTEKLLQSFSRLVKIKRDRLSVAYTRVQLWGAAVPLNVMETNGEHCVFDSAHNVGICGDWLAYPSIEGAAVSGIALAENISKHISGSVNDSTTLQPHFKREDTATHVGCFKTNPQMKFKPRS